MSDQDATQPADPLSVVVEKPRTEAVIDALEAEGVYDDTRHVEEHDDETVVVPVTARPETVGVREVVTKEGPERFRTLADHLEARGWTADELDRAPGSWAIIGSVVLVDPGDAPRHEELGEALLSLHANADTVLARHGIEGRHREPDVTVIAGVGETETIHTEHGTQYALDLSQVMFSPGNKAERARMQEVVEPGERVFDMFAGIGYFTLPMAQGGAQVTAAEHNPAAFRFLLENAMLNEVSDAIDAYRADCRTVETTADRVVMGYYDAHEYLDAALAALEPGGVVHMHEATPEARLWERPVERLRDAATDQGRTVEIRDRRRVKTHSEGVVHVVVDAAVE
jgi:tRNA wybutosine-synthesizing protein 2